MHHQNGRELTEHGKPAQPHQRVEPHVLWPVLGPRQAKHAANVTIAGGLSKQVGRPCTGAGALRLPGGVFGRWLRLRVAGLFDHRHERAQHLAARPRR